MADSPASNYTQVIFVNIPVNDLPASIKFYTALGFVQNQTFSDERAAMVSLPMDPAADPKAAHKSPIKVMLLSRPRFAEFVPAGRSIPDAHTATGVLLCLSMRSREAVDEFVGKAANAGGNADVREPQEYGYMYGRSFEDLDGHLWETVWMDPKAYEGKE